MSNTTLDKAEKVVCWIEENDGFWDSSVLELRKSPLGGIGVFAKEDVDPSVEPRVLLRLHKKNLLSLQTSRIANLLFEQGIEGELALVLAFIYEKHHINESPWKDYISAIQYLNADGSPVLPPSLWDRKQKIILQGSELEMMGGLDESESQDAFERACTFALNEYETSGGTIELPFEFDIVDKIDEDIKKRFEHFIAIGHALASRDFEIDEYHQVALCPGADLFNHAVRNNVRFESFFDACEFCGRMVCDHVPHSNEEMGDDEESASGSEIDEEEEHEDSDAEDESHSDRGQEGDGMLEESDEGEDEEEDFEGPIEDFIAHIEESLVKEKEEDEIREKEELTGPTIYLFDESGPAHPDYCCDVVLQKKVRAGDEIFNTYGDYSNTVLLSKYGFVIPNNSNDTVSLGLQILKLKKKKQYSRYFQWWEDSGYFDMREYLNNQNKHHDHEHGDDEDHCDDGCCDDGCCDGEEENDAIPSWSMEMMLQHSGEPSPLTFALMKLLSFNAAELQKFLHKKTKINLQLLTSSSPKAYKLLSEMVDARVKKYGSLDHKKLLKKGGPRERLAAQLVLDELAILQRAKKVIHKKI